MEVESSRQVLDREKGTEEWVMRTGIYHGSEIRLSDALGLLWLAGLAHWPPQTRSCYHAALATSGVTRDPSHVSVPGPVEFGPTPRATSNWAKHLYMLYEIFWPMPRAVALVAQGPYPPLQTVIHELSLFYCAQI